MKKAYSYVRFSSVKQLKGDSLRRQLEASRAYADEHNLELDDSLRDIGVSGYTGENAATGALADFLSLIESGKVPKGSVLILESLDRLSRQQVIKTLSLFTGILAAGVEIVTLADRQHYTADSINDAGQLMFSIMTMSRAYQESDVKSQRLTKAWQQKRAEAERGKPLGNLCPGWLSTKPDMSGFDVDNDKVQTIKRVFDMYLSGLGRRKIASTLNREQVPPVSKRKAATWNEVYIQKLITNPALIGHFQPMSKGEPVGEVIKSYYPKVIDESLYYKAQAEHKKRVKPNQGGNRGVLFTNLFTGMCKCLDCGSTYRLVSHRKARSIYLTCASYYEGRGCDCSKRWRYRFIERAALMILEQHIDWTAVYGVDDTGKAELESQLVVAEAKLAEAEQQAERFAMLFASADSALLDDATKRYKNAIQTASQAQEQVKTLRERIAAYTPAEKQVGNLQEALGKLEYDNDYETRSHVNALLKQAGLTLWFNETGVFYSIKNQHGILIDAANEETVFEQVLLAGSLAKAQYARDAIASILTKIDSTESINK